MGITRGLCLFDALPQGQRGKAPSLDAEDLQREDRMGRPRANSSELKVKLTGGEAFSLRRVPHPEPGLLNCRVRGGVEKAGRGCPGGEGSFSG